MSKATPGKRHGRGEAPRDMRQKTDLGKISVSSPIARALIGKAKGTTVEVEAPSGAKIYKVHQVEWLERAPFPAGRGYGATVG